MKNSPCAKLMSRTTPNINASPAATIAYIAPRVSPWTSCSISSSTPLPRSVRCACSAPPGSGRLGRHLLHDLELVVLDLEQDHVDVRLVVVVELDGTHRRVRDVHLLQGVADRLAIDLAGLLDRDLDGGHDRVLEGDGRHGAVDPRGHLPAFGPLLVPRGIESRRPVARLDGALGEPGRVLGLEEELRSGDAAPRVDP